VNHSLPASAFVGKYYEWNYSRVYLRNPATLSAPTNLTATAGPSQISLAWNAVSGATSYNVYRGTSASGESVTPIATGITGTNFADTSATNGTRYYYFVTAINGSGRSDPSNEANSTPQVTTYTLSPIADSYIRAGSYTGSNYGTVTTLVVKQGATGDLTRKTYFKFDLSGISGTVSSATLRCYGSISTADTVTIGTYPVTDNSWTETGITWNNAPAIGATALSSMAVTNTASQYLSWDVSDYIGSHLGGSASIALQSPKLTSVGAAFGGNSREAVSNPPQLVITTY
jgi:hypothetical protein